jgi:NAD(P)-dependent dehydrogenase (short-subunit alcohol dehydrogenase family)
MPSGRNFVFLASLGIWSPQDALRLTREFSHGKVVDDPLHSCEFSYRRSKPMRPNPNASDSMQHLFDLGGKVACVVGGGGYLGGPICRALADHGARVVVADLRVDAAQRTAAQLREAGLPAEALALDITDETGVAAEIDRLVDRFGRLDVVVNATAYSTGKPQEEMTLADFEAGLRVCLAGAFLLGREAGRVMIRQRSGSIIQFGSMYGLVSPDPRVYGPGQRVNPVDYETAKAGILQLVRYQAVMWAPHGVRVNAVVPGPFPNPAGQGADTDFLARLSRRVPLGRVGRAEEIAGAVLFLASHAASYVTGTYLVIDGGWTAW